MFSRLLHLSLVALLMFTASGCNLLYRMDIQQGNVITQEMVDKLRPGMTRSQVRFVLGTPLVADPFRPDRWDYYYSFRHGVQGKVEQRRLTIIFQGDQLARIEGDVVEPQLKTPVGNATDTTSPSLLGPPMTDGASPAPSTAPTESPPAADARTTNPASPLLAL